MANTLADLKRNRDALQANLIKQSQSSERTFEEDTRYWKPKVDKAGNGYSIIRFLPPTKGEEVAWIKYWDHFFKGPTGQWYVENSLTTIGEQDPCSEYNSELWNRGDDEGKRIARKQKRRLHYVSNILVVKDPANPENEGKVFLYEYGKKIFEKLNGLMNPEVTEFMSEDDVTRIVPCDFWEGCNFIMKIKTIREGENTWRNYDDSQFDIANCGKIADTDKEIEKIWDAQYSLNEIVDPSQFKSYDELKARFNVVLGIDNSSPEPVAAGPVMKTVETVPDPLNDIKESTSNTMTDDEVDFFSKLAEDD